MAVTLAIETPLQDDVRDLVKRLNALDIFPRRYFYPSLDTLPYVSNRANLETSRRVANNILCLPLFHDLAEEEQDIICLTLNGRI